MAMLEERKSKDALIATLEARIVRYEEQIDRLMDIVEQQRVFQQTINLQNAQIAGSFVNAQTVQSHQIGGDIYNTDNLKLPD